MGLNTERIFLDSCIAIYLIEEHQTFVPKIESLIASFSNAELVISDLTVMECLVGPMRSRNVQVEEKFRKWFADITVFSITRHIFDAAAKLRSFHPSLKTPDAIHIATILHYNCDEFWTNDERLRKVESNIIKNIL